MRYYEMEKRPTWQEYFKSLTLLTGTRSPCGRLQVGCIIVKDNRIVAQGYNGYLPGCPHTPMIRNNHEIATIHAEQNAVTDCARRGVSCDKSTAYITHYPCVNCMKVLCAAGIQQIFYISDYHNDEFVPKFAHQSGVKITKI